MSPGTHRDNVHAAIDFLTEQAEGITFDANEAAHKEAQRIKSSFNIPEEIATKIACGFTIAKPPVETPAQSDSPADFLPTEAYQGHGLNQTDAEESESPSGPWAPVATAPEQPKLAPEPLAVPPLPPGSPFATGEWRPPEQPKQFASSTPPSQPQSAPVVPWIPQKAAADYVPVEPWQPTKEWQSARDGQKTEGATLPEQVATEQPEPKKRKARAKKAGEEPEVASGPTKEEVVFFCGAKREESAADQVVHSTMLYYPVFYQVKKGELLMPELTSDISEIISMASDMDPHPEPILAIEDGIRIVRAVAPQTAHLIVVSYTSAINPFAETV